MPPCKNRHHPQVPQTYVALTISYCHQCMAWQVIASAHTQHGEDDVRNVMSIMRDFGPFDDVTTVIDEAEQLIDRYMLRPGRPWDLSAARAELADELTHGLLDPDPDQPA